MRNLIKKILRENEFQWMKDINPKIIDLTDTWVIKNDLIDHDPHMVSVQEKLFDLGFEWADDGYKDVYKPENKIGLAIFVDTDDERLQFWDSAKDVDIHDTFDIIDDTLRRDYPKVYSSSDVLNSFDIVTPFNK